MRSLFRGLAPLALLLASSAVAGAQPKGGPLPPEDALKALKVADGFQVELFAAEPLLINPTSIDVDHKGRVWVAEAVNYRRKNFGRPILRPEGDRIVVLIDAKGEGKATESKTFYQGTEIYGPLGVCVAPYADGKGQRVFVCQSPDILVFEDKDGDLKADGPPKKFLTGIGGFDHDHGVHGINIGPDGKLYFTIGDSGVTGLQSADGKGKKWVSNTTDVQKGTVWRVDQDGTNLELIAHNFRNNYECCVDSFGEVWLSDNDDDGNQQTRICFVMPGGNYGYGPRGAGQTHWHEEQPGIVHKTLRTGFGSPTGITFYEGTLFPKKYQGSLLHCDAGPRELRWFHRKPKGAGYELEKEILLTSSDNWFRVSDVCVAPDGSIFVADWYDRGVGGHGMGDPTDGRIYRITPKGHTGYKVPEVKLDDAKSVVEALGSPNQATRALGLAVLASKAKLAGKLPVFKDLSPEANARLSWASTRGLKEANSEWMAIIGADLLLRDDPQLHALSVRLLRSLDEPGGDKKAIAGSGIEKLGAPARRELLLWLRDWPADAATPIFYTLAKQYDGQDIFYRAALNIACGTDPARRDAILADFDKHFPEWDDKTADLVWELRPKSVLPRLGKLLGDAKLTATQKARVIDIIAANDDPEAGKSVLEVLKSDAAPEVKARAIESLKQFLPTKWKPLQGGKELASVIDALLTDAKTQATGLQLVAAVGGAERVAAVAAIASDEKAALDVRKEAVRTLGKIPAAESVAALAKVGTPENPLSIPVIQALGDLLPKGQKPPAFSTQALEALQKGVTSEKATPALKSAALSALAGNQSGTQWLLEAHKKGELPKDLVAEAGRLLRNSPFQGLRNQALLAFPAAGKLDPKKLPPISELAKRPGDVARGKAVWAASVGGAAQCGKCHMVRGVGGQVGPDLSMIGKKGSRENLYESILVPSKAIADQYIQSSVTTSAEVTISGLLVAETADSLTLRDANGKDTTVAKKDVEGPVRKLKVSIMPDDIVASLTEDELIDLVAYMETLKTASYTPDTFHVIGPFPSENMDAALDAAHGPEKGEFNANATYTWKGVTAVGWKTIRPDGKGYFDLAAHHGPKAANSASYMYAEFDSPAEQAGEVLLGPDDGAKLWVNGKEVFTTRDTKAAAPETHKVPVALVKGKNTVLLKVANGDNPHGFFFSLTSAEELKPVAKK
ncbi:PVC-type heme-binding CxxCH protein [Gemmata sp.]|uniref:PVC-type heme-binding CxxCH protein n=1 Tax=Gemmata sp. TaxID=1914242 RepID=UPI003F7283E9